MATFELKRVISGGQTGADIGGLKAAKACGIPTGGWMPKGYLTEDGPRPEYERLYGMLALPTTEYTKRTRRNVEFARGTICIARRWNADGVAATIRYAEELQRPLLKVTYPESSRSQQKVTHYPLCGGTTKALVESYLSRVLAFPTESDFGGGVPMVSPKQHFHTQCCRQPGK